MDFEQTVENINRFFEKILPEELPGYEDRPYQAIACKKILEAMRDGQTVIMEGPTGSGKSLIALLPSFELSWMGIIYATAGINLQEQLLYKDLPFISGLYKKHFDKEVRFALLKGRNNFLCLRKAGNAIADFFKLREQHSVFAPALKDAELRQSQMAKDIAEWAVLTATGDKTELKFEPYAEIWSKFSSTSDECHRRSCKHCNDCLYRAHKGKALGAHIVVANYNVLIHLLDELKESRQILICDEAHEIPNILRDAFEKNFSLSSFKRLISDVERLDEMLGGSASLSRVLNKDYAFAVVGSFFEELRNYSERYLKANASAVTVDWSRGVSSLNVLNVLGELRDYVSNAAGNGPVLDEFEGVYDEDAANGMDPAAIFALNLAEKVDEAIQVVEDSQRQGDPNIVFWVEHVRPEGKEPYVKLCYKMKKVDKLCRETFLTVPQTVFMSATLCTGKNFSFIKSELGIEEAKEFIIQSAFDLRNNTLWYLPKGLPPNPNSDSRFADIFAAKVAEVLQITRGRMMILCTSYSNIKRIHGYLERTLPQFRYYVQGHASKKQILEDFKRHQGEDSVIIGSRSFFTGVDIQGRALSCVVLDKLPFETPTDPVMQALVSDTVNGFKHYQLGNMIILLKQIFGRLIRTRNDTGIFMIGDPRIGMGGSSYAQRIKDSFSFEAVRTMSLDKVKEFWDARCK